MATRSPLTGNPTNRALFITVVVLVILLFTTLVYTSFITERPQREQPSTNQTPGVTEQPGSTTYVTDEGRIILAAEEQFGYGGTITALSPGRIELATSTFNREELVDVPLTVTARTSDDTVFVEYNPLVVPSASQSTLSSLTFTDLAVGDTVDVRAASNVQGQTTFDAVEVRRITIDSLIQ